MRTAPWALGLTLVACAALAPAAAGAGVLTFWLGGDGDWFDEEHWSVGVPTEDDHAEFDTGGTATIGGGYARASVLAVDVGAVEQFGGLCEVSNLRVAGYEGESASYTLGGEASLQIGTLEIAAADFVTASFTQNSGTVSVGSVTLGQYVPSSVGTAEIFSGSFSANFLYLGNGGDGTFLHHDGTVDVNQFMRLGEYEDARGRYELDSSAELSCATQTIGNRGTGEMIHDGGSNTAASVVLGGEATGDGTYELGGGGWFETENLNVGGKGTGVFHQFSGDATIGDSLFVADGENSTGTVYLDGGNLSCYSAVVGYRGRGDFQHGAGTHTVEGELLLGAYCGSSGTYTLGGDGELTAEYLVVGSGGDGEFIQEGGSVLLSASLHLGWGSEVSRYEMSGGTLEAPWQFVGDWDVGEFEQSGGDNVATEMLYVGYDYGSFGVYELSDTGTVTATNETIGSAGAGTFRQYGGCHEVTGTLTLGEQAWPEWDDYSEGTLELRDGELTVGTLDVAPEGYGTVQFEAAMSVTVRDALRLGPLSRLLAVPGAEIVLDGADFQVCSTDGDALADLANLTLTTIGSQCRLEVAGRRDGAEDANFLVGMVAVGTSDDEGHATLVDLVDNGRRDGGFDECLFLGQIEIEPGSSLDVNGLWLYVEGDALAQVQWYIDESMLLDGTGRTLVAWYDVENDWTLVVPEPAALVLALMGLLCLLPRICAVGRAWRIPPSH